MTSYANSENLGETTRIINGENSRQDAWPYMVSISVYGQHLCGASLIANQWILSAAHCLVNSQGQRYPTDVIKAIVGGASPKSASISSGVNVSALYLHPDYSKQTKNNDIALLKLEKPIRFDTPLPHYFSRVSAENTINALNTGRQVTVLGWGSTVAYSPAEDVIAKYPRVLQEVQLSLKTEADFPDLKYAKQCSENTLICAFTQGKDACQGDSGGPLLLQVNNTWKQIGIVSRGRGCASSYPGIYTRVATYKKWINSYVQNATITSHVEFNAQPIGKQKSKIMMVRNNSHYDATFTYQEDIKNSPQFSFDSSLCEYISALSTCTFNVYFTPLNTQSKHASITMTSTIPNSASVRSEQTGRGIVMQSKASAGALNFTSFYLLMICCLFRYAYSKGAFVNTKGKITV